MNEKYQQALKYLENVIIKAEEYYPEEATAVDTLQELVDMMKPLEFEELEVGMEVIIPHMGIALILDKSIRGNSMIVKFIGGNVKLIALINIEVYRNIWEVE